MVVLAVFVLIWFLVLQIKCQGGMCVCVCVVEEVAMYTAQATAEVQPPHLPHQGIH